MFGAHAIALLRDPPVRASPRPYGRRSPWPSPVRTTRVARRDDAAWPARRTPMQVGGA
ncbi:hypothetical protein ACFSM7_10870 [Clavibacter michiganensis subsp. tessellarius]|uniref:hypothetical protein n=1 Tax=Clavibacter tessellarius TaxID=31965 RepID=UPI00362803E6